MESFEFHLPMWLAAVVILALLLTSAFFAVAETALVSSSRARMHALARKGNPRAIRVERLRERQDRVLSAGGLGNNPFNLVASSIASRVFIDPVAAPRGALPALAMSGLVVLVCGGLAQTS